ncbi:MAG: hypothetical protein H0U16_12425, partial [Actinobacteria bacterium]|nr:hypothetical protein [Actinomycetota bacterium]
MSGVFRSNRAILAALLSVLVACTGSGGDVEPTRSGDGATPDIRSGGAITFGIIGEPATWDPYAAQASAATFALVRPLYPSLFSFEPDGSVRNYLAESFEKTKSGFRVTIEKARWSNGRRITARDVVASARRARAPSGFARVRSAVVVGTRKIAFRAPFADWKRALATASFVLPAGRVPRGKTVSGGPYVLESVTPGLEAVFARNDRWWGDDDPRLHRVVVQFIQDLDVMLALLEDRRLDGAAPTSSVNLGARLDAIGVEHEESLGWETVYLDLEGAQLDDSGRHALARAVDRALIEEGFIRDSGRTVDTLHPSPGRRGAEGEWTAAAFPIGDASNERIRLAVGVGDELTELIQRALRLQFEDAGFEVELVTTDAATFYGPWELTDPMDVAIRRAA